MWCHRQLRPLAGWFLRYHYKMKGAASKRRQVIRLMSHLHSIGWAHMAIGDGWRRAGGYCPSRALDLAYLVTTTAVLLQDLGHGKWAVLMLQAGVLSLRHTN